MTLIPLVADRVAGRDSKQLLASIRRVPVPETHPKALCSLDSPYARGEARVKNCPEGVYDNVLYRM